MDYKVSVIIPVYNAEKYLRDCFDSLVNQTIKEIQIIAVNDGSKDGSEAICKEFASTYTNFEYYFKDNGGSASARNLGLEHASGEYIGFVDADDWVELNMFERMYLTAKDNHDTDMVLCRVFEDECFGAYDYYFPRKGYYNRQQIEEEIFPYTLPFVNEKGTFRSIRWSNCLRLTKKSVIDDYSIKFFSGSRRCEDLGFTLECTIHSNSYYFLDESLYHNRPNPDSKSRNYTKDMWKSIKALMVYFVGVVNSYHEYDLLPQLSYCIFYFCVTVIRNEATLKNKKLSIQLMEEVVSDKICCDAIGCITASGMNNEYTGFYRCIKASNAKNLRKYCDRIRFKKKHIAPIANRVLKNKAIMKVYKKTRGK